MPKTTQAAPRDGDLVEVTIARGTLWDEDGQHGPGEAVHVTREDADRLIAVGMVHGADWRAPEEVQDGNLKIRSSDGPTVTAIGVA